MSHWKIVIIKKAVRVQAQKKPHNVFANIIKKMIIFLQPFCILHFVLVIFLQFQSLAPSPGALMYPKIFFFEYDHQMFALLGMVHTDCSGVLTVKGLFTEIVVVSYHMDKHTNNVTKHTSFRNVILIIYNIPKRLYTWCCIWWNDYSSCQLCSSDGFNSDGCFHSLGLVTRTIMAQSVVKSYWLLRSCEMFDGDNQTNVLWKPHSGICSCMYYVLLYHKDFPFTCIVWASRLWFTGW